MVGIWNFRELLRKVHSFRKKISMSSSETISDFFKITEFANLNMYRDKIEKICFHNFVHWGGNDSQVGHGPADDLAMLKLWVRIPKFTSSNLYRRNIKLILSSDYLLSKFCSLNSIQTSLKHLWRRGHWKYHKFGTGRSSYRKLQNVLKKGPFYQEKNSQCQISTGWQTCPQNIKNLWHRAQQKILEISTWLK